MAGRYRRPTTPAQQAKAAEAREAKLAALQDTLHEQVSALAAGPQWRAWLDVAAKFHNYSFGNTVLIMAQKPEATQVAGYTLWHELGRQVDKGEKGIAILAPITRKPDTDDAPQRTDTTSTPPPASDGTAASRRVVGFRPAYVWDLSQTTGDPLPTPPMPILLAGTAPEGLWDALAVQVEAAGFTVDRREIAGDNGPNGYTDFAMREVVIRSDVDAAQAVKTLAHELAHVLMHDPAVFKDRATTQCRGDQEVEAESVAYLVAAEHGLDTAEYTFAYVAGWAAQTGDVDAALRAAGGRVLGTAHSVLEATHDAMPTDGRAAEPTATVNSVTSDIESLTTRVAKGAERTAQLRDDATPRPNSITPETVPRDRLVAANAAAGAYFTEQYATSWAPDYLTQRIGDVDLPAGRVGYAPAGWTPLTDHLRQHGFTDPELVGAGLTVRAATGRLVDRFRDRMMFPIRARTAAGDHEIVGFVGRRNPAQDGTNDTRNPKYLNTGQTELYTKGEHLYGLVENTATLKRGGLAVLVEGPVDALAVDVASRGMLAGVAPLGTSFTEAQARQVAAALPRGSDRVVVATDPDDPGRNAAARAYDLLTARGLDPRVARLPTGLDPAATVELHGPAMLMSRITDAEPMPRQVVDYALEGRATTWAHERVAAARVAADIILKAPPTTWDREIIAVSQRTELEEFTLREAVIDGLGTGSDALGRLRGRDRRDDLDRGQHVEATPAQLAAMSSPRTGVVRLAHGHEPRPETITRALTANHARSRN